MLQLLHQRAVLERIAALRDEGTREGVRISEGTALDLIRLTAWRPDLFPGADITVEPNGTVLLEFVRGGRDCLIEFHHSGQVQLVNGLEEGLPELRGAFAREVDEGFLSDLADRLGDPLGKDAHPSLSGFPKIVPVFPGSGRVLRLGDPGSRMLATPVTSPGGRGAMIAARPGVGFHEDLFPRMDRLLLRPDTEVLLARPCLLEGHVALQPIGDAPSSWVASIRILDVLMLPARLVTAIGKCVSEDPELS